ncbi:MAG: PorT family protein [Bacteroidales bacterium]|nr:PorT family protein [Bacteroidales bacterium]MCF8455430.1 PorT family protein [Bacteroidales bacterium]
MKKTILFVMLVTVWSVIYSQEAGKKVRIGLELAPSFSWFKSDYEKVENDALKLSNRVGVVFDYNFFDNYFVSTGIFMSWQKGDLRYTDSNINFDIDHEIKTFNTTEEAVVLKYALKYIEIPIGLKLKTNEIGYMTYFAKFGLNTAFNISAMGDANQQSVENADFSKEVNFINVGYHIGGGMEYSLSSNFIFTGGLTFQQGFIDVTTNTDGREKDKTIMNQVRLNLGILF